MYMDLMIFDMFELQIGLPSPVLSYAQANTSHGFVTCTRLQIREGKLACLPRFPSTPVSLYQKHNWHIKTSDSMIFREDGILPASRNVV